MSSGSLSTPPSTTPCEKSDYCISPDNRFLKRSYDFDVSDKENKNLVNNNFIDLTKAVAIREEELLIDLAKGVNPELDSARLRHLLNTKINSPKSCSSINNTLELKNQYEILYETLKKAKSLFESIKKEYFIICKRIEEIQDDSFKLETVLRRTIAEEYRKVTILEQTRHDNEAKIRKLTQKNENLKQKLNGITERYDILEQKRFRCQNISCQQDIEKRSFKKLSKSATNEKSDSLGVIKNQCTYESPQENKYLSPIVASPKVMSQIIEKVQSVIGRLSQSDDEESNIYSRESKPRKIKTIRDIPLTTPGSRHLYGAAASLSPAPRRVLCKVIEEIEHAKKQNLSLNRSDYATSRTKKSSHSLTRGFPDKITQRSESVSAMTRLLLNHGPRDSQARERLVSSTSNRVHNPDVVNTLERSRLSNRLLSRTSAHMLRDIPVRDMNTIHNHVQAPTSFSEQYVKGTQEANSYTQQTKPRKTIDRILSRASSQSRQKPVVDNIRHQNSYKTNDDQSTRISESIWRPISNGDAPSVHSLSNHPSFAKPTQASIAAQRLPFAHSGLNENPCHMSSETRNKQLGNALSDNASNFQKSHRSCRATKRTSSVQMRKHNAVQTQSSSWENKYPFPSQETEISQKKIDLNFINNSQMSSQPNNLNFKTEANYEVKDPVLPNDKYNSNDDYENKRNHKSESRLSFSRKDVLSKEIDSLLPHNRRELTQCTTTLTNRSQSSRISDCKYMISATQHPSSTLPKNEILSSKCTKNHVIREASSQQPFVPSKIHTSTNSPVAKYQRSNMTSLDTTVASSTQRYNDITRRSAVSSHIYSSRSYARNRDHLSTPSKNTKI